MFRKLLLHIIYCLDLIILKNKNWILFSSQPDFSDNSFAFFQYIIKKKETKKDCKIIWLVDNINNKIDCENKIKKYTNNLNAQIIVVIKNSFYGLWYYLKSRFFFLLMVCIMELRYQTIMLL